VSDSGIVTRVTMKCPTCQENTPDAWTSLHTFVNGGTTHGLRRWRHGHTQVTLDYMNCANDECGELVIRVHETTHVRGAVSPLESDWLACPRAARRPVNKAVPEHYRRDYAEAAAILDLSPRMSAVLSRRILADLLEEYAGQDAFSLTTRIDNIVADTSRPSELRQNLHYLREIADFSAHTQKDDQAEIIEVDQQEAEWTLDVIDRLFDYFIVAPEIDRAMRKTWDEKLAEADRKPIGPLPDDPSD
jgi:hypothetical protein